MMFVAGGLALASEINEAGDKISMINIINRYVTNFKYPLDFRAEIWILKS